MVFLIRLLWYFLFLQLHSMVLFALFSHPAIFFFCLSSASTFLLQYSHVRMSHGLIKIYCMAFLHFVVMWFTLYLPSSLSLTLLLCGFSHIIFTLWAFLICITTTSRHIHFFSLSYRRETSEKNNKFNPWTEAECSVAKLGVGMNGERWTVNGVNFRNLANMCVVSELTNSG